MGYGYYADTVFMRILCLKTSCVAYTSSVLYHRLNDINSVSRRKQAPDLYITYFERLMVFANLFEPNIYYPIFYDTMNIFVDSVVQSHYSREVKKRIKKIGKLIYKYRKNLLDNRFRRIKYYIYLIFPFFVHIIYKHKK